MNGVEINGEVFNKEYHSEKLPFTGNGFGGGLETDCVILPGTTTVQSVI